MRPAALPFLITLTLAVFTPVRAASQGQSQSQPEDVLIRQVTSQSAEAGPRGEQSGSPDEGVAEGMHIVGKNDLGGRGFNADVWEHDGFAYVGQWGFGAEQPDKCPSTPESGVRVLDVSDPSDPTVVSTLQNPPLTTAEDVQVVTYPNGQDIAMVGIQACFRTDPAIPRGLQLFNVTDPTAPIQVGFHPLDPPVGGVHEFWAVVRPDDQVLAIEAVPFSMIRDPAEKGDVRVVDVSVPSAPVELADWSSEETLGFGTFDGFGCFPFVFGHGAFSNPEGNRAYVAHWDIGTVILDISNPASPLFVGRTPYPENVEGDAHSLDLTSDEQHLLQADEVIPPNSNCQAPDRHTEKGWGYLRVFDISNPAAPEQMASYHTPNSLSPNRMRKGDYSIHNPFVVGDTAYLSWYSDGVRVVDISDPEAPSERAYLVPPAAKDPHHVLGYVPEVWGVVVDERGCVFLSDMNFGLYVVAEDESDCE